MFRKFSNRFTFSLAGIALLLAIILQALTVNDTTDLCLKAEKALALKEKQALNILKWFTTAGSSNPLGFSEDLLANKPYFDKEGIIVLAYRNDTLKFWTSTEAPMDVPAHSLTEPNGMLHLRNGWYEYFAEEKNNLRTISLLRIKPEYDVQNSYFDNSFVSWLGLPKESELRIPVTLSNNTIRSTNGKALFEVVFNESAIQTNNYFATWSLILFFASVLLLSFSLIKYFFQKSISSIQFLVFSILLLGIRSLMVYFKLPSLLYACLLYTSRCV